MHPALAIVILPLLLGVLACWRHTHTHTPTHIHNHPEYLLSFFNFAPTCNCLPLPSTLSWLDSTLSSPLLWASFPLLPAVDATMRGKEARCSNLVPDESHLLMFSRQFGLVASAEWCNEPIKLLTIQQPSSFTSLFAYCRAKEKTLYEPLDIATFSPIKFEFSGKLAERHDGLSTQCVTQRALCQHYRARGKRRMTIWQLPKIPH